MARKTSKKTPKPRSGIAVAMIERHSYTQTMRDRRCRRSKDVKKSWKREEW